MSSHNSRLTSEILRSVVGQIIFKCIKCFKINPLSYDQLMGDLPEGRIIPSRPFTCTAIEYMGPFLIKNGHLRTTKTLKSYVAIFVCFATKAVHLELVCDCTSSTFLNALKRFMSRRGKVSLLYSDNGSNFKGANRELSNLFRSQNFTSEVGANRVMAVRGKSRSPEYLQFYNRFLHFFSMGVLGMRK
jgi:hypothetical protein